MATNVDTCWLCDKGFKKRYLSQLCGLKSLRESYLDKISEVLGYSLNEIERKRGNICQYCAQKLSSFVEFKRSALSSLRELRERRGVVDTAITGAPEIKRPLPGSCEKPIPKRKRTVFEHIIASVEKLKVATGGNVASTSATVTSGESAVTLTKSMEKLSVRGKLPLKSTAKKRLNMTDVSEDHDYCKVLTYPSEYSTDSELSGKKAKDVLRKTGLQREESDVGLQNYERQAINEAVKEGSIKMITKKILSFKCMKEAMCNAMLRILSADRLALLTRDSVHYDKSCEQLSHKNVFANIILETGERASFLLDVLTVLFSSSTGQCHGTKQDIASVATVVGMTVHHRDKQASIVQRLYTSIAIRCHADNQLFKRLNKCHLTLSDKRRLVDTFASHSEEKIVQTISTGKDGKINGDNLDLHVTTNDQRMTNKSKDYHYFASDWTPYRVQLNSSTTEINAEPAEIKVDLFTPTPEEIGAYKSNLKQLLARELLSAFDCFSWMKLLVPKHIHHEFSESMAQKSSPHIMPILLRNEAKYEDCIAIMEAYTNQLHNWYLKAGRGNDLEGIQVPVGGDQLTRVRLQGAKALRAGAHTAEERFDILQPVIIELFHTQMDFLQKLCKKFLKLNHARDPGTLANLRLLIERTSVNNNVKSRFATHNDFVLLIGKAYVVEAAMEYFGMESKESKPTLNQPPDGIERAHRKKKTESFEELMAGFIDFLLGPLTMKVPVKQHPENIEVEITLGKSTRCITVQNPSDVFGITFQFGPQVFKVCINTTDLIKSGAVVVKIPGYPTNINVRHKVSKPDELENYTRNFLQWYFLLLTTEDSIAEGDITRTNIALKLMIPFFYSHSKMSKYLVECVDYILKTEVMLSHQMALQVRCSSFVNLRGGMGNNVAADMEKEHQVKFLKDLIRGLGANKTEKSIVAVCSAGPVVLDVVNNFDSMIGYGDIKTTHKHRDQSKEQQVLYDCLRKLRPFKTIPGRQLYSFCGIEANIFENLDRPKFCNDIVNIANRLKRNLFVETEVPDVAYSDMSGEED